MRISYSLFLVALAAAAVLSGCSKPHPPPPRERNELVMRFFKSIRNGDCEAAASQGEKIFRIDSNNIFVGRLVAIQQSNAFVQEAQRKLNSGDVEGAIKTIKRGTGTYPDNQRLRLIAVRLAQLRNAKKLLQAMEDAGNSTAMMASLTAAKTGLSDNISHRLKVYFANYASRIETMKKREKVEDRKQNESKIRSFDEPGV